MLNKVGHEVYRNSREGGGAYVVIGHVNCERSTCTKLVELREQQEPSKEHRKRGYYYTQWSICEHCGLYMHGDRKTFIK